MIVEYPSHNVQKTLIYEAQGGKPFDVSIIIPTITRPESPFTLKVIVRDEKGYPSLFMKEKLCIELDGVSKENIIVNFTQGETAIALVKGLTIQNTGFYRYKCVLNGKNFFSNPTKCTNKSENNIYWGDPHIHTTIGDCHPETCRTLSFCYTAGKHLSGLDFIAVTDHVSNGRCSKGKWKEEVTACEINNEPGTFVTLPAYESSFKGGQGGDNNIYFTRPLQMYVEKYEDGNIKDLCNELANEMTQSGFDFFVAPHHTSRHKKHGEIPDEIYPGAHIMPVVEIHSTWGTSEYRGNPNPLKEIHFGPSYAIDLLNKGLMLGFIGGTDSHRSMTFPLDINANLSSDNQLPGITAVFAQELSREDIFYGMKNRNCYAVSLERIYLDVHINGVYQGQSIPCNSTEEAVNISITAAAQTTIHLVEIIKNGKVIYSYNVDCWKTSLEYEDTNSNSIEFLESPHLGKFSYYYVRISCESGARAWSSPIWITF